MQTLIEGVQPYVTTIATTAVGVLTTFVLAGLNTVKGKANTHGWRHVQRQHRGK
ncbi:hypothetical protein [Paenibacillus terrae]|uniref:hypothetical protein n=1 Tax=Paenibacillus terrae TaxID=159743 RepID=UPI00207B8326|nr:hypothetical protein [Paenibacillus terrae]